MHVREVVLVCVVLVVVPRFPAFSLGLSWLLAVGTWSLLAH